MNVYLVPDRLYITTWISYGIGITFCLIGIVLQPVAANLSKKLDTHHVIFKIMFENVFIAFTNFGTINMWRSLWQIYNLYVLPPAKLDLYNYTVESCWLTHGVAVVVLLCLFNFKGAVTSGVDIDGSYSNGDGIRFHMDYTKDVVSQVKA